MFMKNIYDNPNKNLESLFYMGFELWDDHFIDNTVQLEVRSRIDGFHYPFNETEGTDKKGPKSMNDVMRLAESQSTSFSYNPEDRKNDTLVSEIMISTSLSAVSRTDKLLDVSNSRMTYCEMQGSMKVYNEGVYDYENRGLFRKAGEYYSFVPVFSSREAKNMYRVEVTLSDELPDMEGYGSDTL